MSDPGEAGDPGPPRRRERVAERLRTGGLLLFEALALPIRSLLNPALFLAVLLYVGRFEDLAEPVPGEANVYRLDLARWAAIALLPYVPWTLLRLGLRGLAWRRAGSWGIRSAALVVPPLVATPGYLVGALNLSLWSSGMEGNIMGFFVFPLLLLGGLLVVAAGFAELVLELVGFFTAGGGDEESAGSPTG